VAFSGRGLVRCVAFGERSLVREGLLYLVMFIPHFWWGEIRKSRMISFYFKQFNTFRDGEI
jgi:hypothetical protein